MRTTSSMLAFCGLCLAVALTLLSQTVTAQLNVPPITRLQVVGSVSSSVESMSQTFPSQPLEGSLLVAIYYSAYSNSFVSIDGTGWTVQNSFTYNAGKKNHEKLRQTIVTKIAGPAEPTTVTVTTDNPDDDEFGLMLQEFTGGAGVTFSFQNVASHEASGGFKCTSCDTPTLTPVGDYTLFVASGLSSMSSSEFLGFNDVNFSGTEFVMAHSQDGRGAQSGYYVTLSNTDVQAVHDGFAMQKMLTSLLAVSIDVDCEGSFSAWDACTEACDTGTRARTFTETRTKLNLGAACVTVPLTELCNIEPCAPPDVDCVYSVGTPSACSVSCGDGTTTAPITITTPASGNGLACPVGDEIASCNEGDCPIDCVVAFDPYGSCSTTCGAGEATRTYTITQAAENGGAACVTTPLTEPCNPGPCPIDCEGNFEPFGECSTTCGDGTATRIFNVTTPAANGGAECVTTPLTQDCNLGNCPIDCQGFFEPYGPCDVTCGDGTSTRTFIETTPAQFGGAECVTTPLTEPCSLAPCPIDCEGNFEPYGICDVTCGDGVETRTFTQTVAAENGGAECVTTPLTRVCSLPPCPIDCEGQFEPYGPCSTTCGAGTSTRIFNVTTPAQFGGADCAVTTPLSETCNLGACPIDCEGTFSAYSACSLSCGPGQQTRTFTQTVAAENGGTPCTTTPLTQGCNLGACPVDCEGTFSDWGACSASCGPGEQTRTFNVTTAAAFGGAECVSTPLTQPCVDVPCPGDCVGDFSAWSPCSVSCGDGSQTREFLETTPATGDGADCVRTPLTQPCNDGDCVIDCQGTFSDYGPCSVSCGDGEATRTFTQTVAAENGGAACVTTPLTEPCNLGPCPVDCIGNFEPYGACSTTCGDGTATRTFTTITPAANGGTECVTTPLTEPCNLGKCPIDCQGFFEPYGPCSTTCGAGEATRIFNVTTPAQFGGAECVTSPLTEACNLGPCPVDCVGNFEPYGACSTTCGDGVETRTFTTTTFAANGGVDCVRSPLTQPCNLGGCPVDCQGTFSDYGSCSTTCGAGEATRTFTELVAAENGGAACVTTPLTEPCNLGPCPVDCVGYFEPYGACSVSCGAGTRTRTFTTTTFAANGGVDCVRTPLTEDCNDGPCPVDCQGTFSVWGACSATCGPGTHTRTFTELVPAANGGAECVATPLSESCEDVACPGDCDGFFDPWSDCSATCGPGTQTRFFYETTPATNGGLECVTTPLTQDCQDVECPINCEGHFTDYGECSTTCGPGAQTRTFNVTTPAQFGGTPCVTTPLSKPCQVVECPIDCVGSFSPYSQCSVSCGPGTRTRTHSITVAAEFGGTECVATPLSESCNLGGCPVDCEGTFSAWGACSTTCGPGEQFRTFTETTAAEFGGLECVTTPTTQPCNDVPCPIDCVGSFGPYGECSQTCGLGFRSRVFTTTVYEEFGGTPCVTTPTAEACLVVECPVDCEGYFTSWSTCSATCGPGTQTRTFVTTTPDAFGGTPCVATPLSQPCQVVECPIDCVGSFSPYSQCSVSCGPGTRTRTHSITVAAEFGGTECVATPLSESCNLGGCPVDCEGTFSAWSACSATCDQGTQSRTFTETTAVAFGGTPCVTTPTLRLCTIAACPEPIDCVGSFSAWDSCSTTCGPGVQSRTWSLVSAAQFGGQECVSTPLVQACNDGVCPSAIDCEGTFSTWSACSATCGPGTRTRTFTVTQPAQNGGLLCVDTPTLEVCNDGACPDPVDCVVTFSDYSACSKTCGIGTQTRTATIDQPALYGGAACVLTPVERLCEDTPCPIDCVGIFSAYSTCSKSCGPGVQTRTFTELVPSSNGGAPCVSTPLQQNCQIVECPINCVGSFTPYGACSTSCGPGTHTRTFVTTTEAQFGGTQCVDTPLAASCNDGPCAIDCVGSFSQWSACSASCGPGTQTRAFSVSVPAQYGGTECVTTPLTRSCQLVNCPIDCVGTFSEYGPCSKTCGPGVHSRTFTETVTAQFGGAACVTTPLTSVCEDTPCPIDCDGTFSTWGACSVSCGPGIQTRSFTQTVVAQYGGAACVTTPVEQPCQDAECPIDCVGSFNSWGACSATCGPGIRSRVFVETRAAQYGGTPCVTSPLTETCNDQECPIDCQGNFSAYSACSASCGDGVATRTFTQTTPAQNGGAPCVTSPTVTVCNNGPCPVDCFGYFTGYGACSVSCGLGGIETRSFVTVTEPLYGGQRCVTTPTTRACQTTVPCPVDCDGVFASWTSCSTTCGDGTRTREFVITKQAANGGAPCTRSDETETCNLADCPVDCVSTLSEWGECSATCAGGDRTRTETRVGPFFNGAACPAVPLTERCNEQDCPAPGDCVGQFSAWASCSVSCGGGSRTRVFSVITEAEPGGQPCVSTPLVETCNEQECPIDCEIVFTPYSDCSVSCGAGTRSRNYQITQPALFGGELCVTTPVVQPCDLGPCPIDCVGSFSEWTPCSVSCGPGTQTRTHTISTPAQHGGAECVATPLSQSCQLVECPIDCVVTATDWSDCSKSCDGGTQIRDVTVTVQPQFGGTPCVSMPTSQTCNTNACPPVIDCVGEYTAYGPCSASCGVGTASREFSVVTPALNGGRQCQPELVEECGADNPCDVDCVETFGAWDACSVTCGAGVQKRTYEVETPAVAQGTPCTEEPLKFRSCPDSPVCVIDSANGGDGSRPGSSQANGDGGGDDAAEDGGGFPVAIVAGGAGGGLLLLVGLVWFMRRNKRKPRSLNLDDNDNRMSMTEFKSNRTSVAPNRSSMAPAPMARASEFGGGNSDTSDDESDFSSSSSSEADSGDSDVGADGGAVVYL